MTTNKFKEQSAEQLINRLSNTEKSKLAEWARLDSTNTIAAGGIGQTLSEKIKACKAWEKLSPKTKKIYEEMVDQYYIDLEESLKEFSEATGYDEDEIEPADALPDDYPLWPYLSAQI